MSDFGHHFWLLPITCPQKERKKERKKDQQQKLHKHEQKKLKRKTLERQQCTPPHSHLGAITNHNQPRRADPQRRQSWALRKGPRPECTPCDLLCDLELAPLGTSVHQIPTSPHPVQGWKLGKSGIRDQYFLHTLLFSSGFWVKHSHDTQSSQ